jgi:hypothetical protein
MQDVVKPDLIFSGLLALCAGARWITVKEAAEGFSNTGLLSVLALFAVAEGIYQTGGKLLLPGHLANAADKNQIQICIKI